MRPITFLAGLHRSGTTPLAEILAAHPQIAGFADTGVTKNEGQFLQSIVPQGNKFRGPGRFAFDARSHLDETSRLVSQENALEIWRSWKPYWDLERPVLLEKSPPSLVRSRFYRALFPGSKFVFVVRHPVVVAMATQKWSKTLISELVLHWCVAYARLLADLPHLEGDYVIVRYEDMVAKGWTPRPILEFLGCDPEVKLPALEDHNEFYDPAERRETIPIDVITRAFGDVLDRFGYDLTKA